MPCPAPPQMHPSRCSTEDSRMILASSYQYPHILDQFPREEMISVDAFDEIRLEFLFGTINNHGVLAENPCHIRQ